MKRLSILLTMIVFTISTVSAQRLVCIPVVTFDSLASKLEQSKYDAELLESYEHELVSKNIIIEAKDMQINSFGDQLSVMTEKVNDEKKLNLHLSKVGKSKTFIIVALVAAVTFLIIK